MGLSYEVGTGVLFCKVMMVGGVIVPEMRKEVLCGVGGVGWWGYIF